jgi:hypothetical protein
MPSCLAVWALLRPVLSYVERMQAFSTSASEGEWLSWVGVDFLDAYSGFFR